MAHYYILPNGQRAENREQAKKILNIPNNVFRTMRKYDLIKKIDLDNEGDAQADLNHQMEDSYGNYTHKT